jgi:hypothetical protein
MRRTTLLIPLALLLGAAPLAAQQVALTSSRGGNADGHARFSLSAVRAESAITIDGRIDEAAWALAPLATDFVQRQPNAGEPATERTEARVLYDADAIYVAIRAYDSAPDSIVAQLARRDQSPYSDWVHVGIDSYNDRRSAFRFSVNPAGVKRDVFHFDDTSEDVSWDAVWEVATAIDEHGWTAEFRIPLSQLRFSMDGNDGAGGGMTWGINFARDIARRNEASFWAPILPNEGAFVSRFGELQGLQGLRRPRRVEIMPYAVTQLNRTPGSADNPFWRQHQGIASGGADLKYGLTSDLTLTATFNPDFGQVEADPSQVNLSASETFFAERRPFFLEGRDLFRFGIGLGDGDLGNEQLFYSRRVGRAPQVGLPAGAAYADRPSTTTILGAAKISGKTANGWSVGVLNALTAEETAAFVNGAGEPFSAVVEPMTNYAVARVARDFRQGGSALGGMFTATNRQLGDDARLNRLRSAAYSGGLNARHRFGDNTYQVDATLVGSYIEGSPDAIARVQRSSVHYFQRPDADHLSYDPERTSLAGAAGSLTVHKLRGDFRWLLFSLFSTPGYEVNDLGFQNSSDYMTGGFWLGYSNNTPGRLFRRWNVNMNQWNTLTTGREHTSTGGNVNGGFQLQNFFSANAGINRNISALSTGALRGGPAIVRPADWNVWAWLGTDHRKPVRWEMNPWGWYQEDSGSHSFGVYNGITVRPSTRFNLSVGPQVNISRPQWQYVATPLDSGSAPRYMFAALDQKTLSLTTRLNYTFSPNLSLQVYAQPFVSAGEYSEFKEATAPRAARYEDHFTPRDVTYDEDNRRYTVDDGETTFAFGRPDFNFKALNSNVVLRWEYRPGSQLFLVWSQARDHFSAAGDFELGRDFRTLLGREGRHVLLIKASYWFGM